MAPSPLLSSPSMTECSDVKLDEHSSMHPIDKVSKTIKQALGSRTLVFTEQSSTIEWPRIIQTFQQYVVPRYAASLNQDEPFPRKTGLLPHVAIAENNLVVLGVLLKLKQEPHFRGMPNMFFSRAMQCAAYFGRLRILKWLLQELSKDIEWTWELDVMAFALKNSRPDVDMLDWLCDHCPTESTILCDADFEKPARLGNFDVIRYLHQRGYTIPASALDTAATSGHLKIVKFLHRYGSEGCSTNAMDGAASNGHLGVVRFLHEHRSEGCTVLAMGRAAANGHLGVVRFLHRQRFEGCTTAAMDGAASEGHMEVVRFLHKHRSEGCSSEAMDKAAARGELEMIKFLHEFRAEGCTSEAMNQSALWGRYCSTMSCYNGHMNPDGSRRTLFYSWDGDHGDEYLAELHAKVGNTDAADTTARRRKRGDLEVVRFLHEHRSEGCTTDAMDEAARVGHLQVVKFLHENRSEGCTTEAMDNAAWRGHLDIVQFLHENRSEGCTTDAIDYAAREGHLEVVQFLCANRSEGCTTIAMSGAAAGGHLDVVKYLHEQRTEGCTTRAMDSAARNGCFETVRFLREHREEGCTTDAMDQAARFGHIDVVKFLDKHSSGCCTTNAMDQAARFGHLEVVKFLHENRSEGCTTAAMDFACGNSDSLEVVQFLHENRTEGCSPQALQNALDAGNIDAVRFLYENRVEIHIFEMVARASVHADPEFIKYACQTVPDAVPDVLLNHSALSDNQRLLAVLCAYSTIGCLFEARALALQIRRHEAVSVLDMYIAKDVESCSLAQHSPEGPRRCQRPSLCAGASSSSSYSFETYDDDSSANTNHLRSHFRETWLQQRASEPWLW